MVIDVVYAWLGCYERGLNVFVSLDNMGRKEENKSPCEVPRR